MLCFQDFEQGIILLICFGKLSGQGLVQFYDEKDLLTLNLLVFDQDKINVLTEVHFGGGYFLTKAMRSANCHPLSVDQTNNWQQMSHVKKMIIHLLQPRLYP